MITEAELMKFKVSELKQKLQELGVQPRGLKADLVRQLAETLNLIELQKQQQCQTQLQQQSQQLVQQQQLFVENLQETHWKQQFEVVQQPVPVEENIQMEQQTNYQNEPKLAGDSCYDDKHENEQQFNQEMISKAQHPQQIYVTDSQCSISVNDQYVYDQSDESSEQLVSVNNSTLFQNEESQSQMTNGSESMQTQISQQKQCSEKDLESNIHEDYAVQSQTNQLEEAKIIPVVKQEPITNQINQNHYDIMNDDIVIQNKENCNKMINQSLIENEKDNGEVDQQRLLQSLNLTEEEWTKMNKNQRRKLKKKLRNKVKRKERDEIEKKRQESKKKQQELEKQRLQQEQLETIIKQENQDNDDDDRMDIDEEDAPEEEKEMKRLEELRRQQELAKQKQLQEENENSIKEDTIEIEYVPEEMTKDSVYLQFLKVFDKFSAVTTDEARRLEQERLANENRRYKSDDRAKLLELKKPVELELKDDDEKDAENAKLSKRKLKQLTRMTVADLKQRVTHPELVEMHDVTAKDPVLLLYLKSTRNTVPVPRHWCYKRKYLQGKRGFEKPPFKLPEFIRRTGIQEMREAVLEKEDSKSLKTKMKEKIRPKMGKIDIDYQKLHDAFFKWQTKPKVTIHGDLYYEGKEFETRLKDKKPGELTNDLRQALGMPTGPNAHKCPPPWLIAMQRYGPPPSYPNIKIPGLNAPIPEGCCFGYHAGGWGKPPVDEYGRPLYGDVFGLTSANREPTQPEEEIDRTHWGEMESDEEEEEESEEEEEEDTNKKGDRDKPVEDTSSGLVTPTVHIEGLVTPSGISTGIPSGLETPDMIELRKRKQQIEAEMENDQQQQLFTVIPEKKVDRFAKDMMGSMHVYDFASLSKTSSKSNGGVEVALDPSELESGQLNSTAVAAKYEQTLRESSSKNPHEDLSDMVAEHVSKQKRKKHESSNKHQDQSSSGSTSTSKSKKYQFKF